MSSAMESSLKESTVKMIMTPPIRRIAGDASLTIPFDNINTNLTRPSIFIEKIPKTSSQFLKQSIGKNNNEAATVLRERSTSSSTSSSNNDSLRSFSADPSLNQDDDDASSNDESNHQWNLNQLISNIPLRPLSELTDFFHKIFLQNERTSSFLIASICLCKSNMKINVFSEW